MIRFDRRAGHLVVDAGDELFVVTRENPDEVRAAVDGKGLLDYAAFDDELWCVVDGAGGPELRRHGWDGAPRGEPVPLAPGGRARLVASPVGAPAAVWLGETAVAVRLDGEHAACEPRGEVTWAMALPDGGCLAVRDGRVVRGGRDGEVPEDLGALDGAVRDGASLADGTAVLLVEDALVTVRDDRLARLAAPGAAAMSLASRRAWALLRVGPHELVLLDVRDGRRVAAWREADEVLDAAVDADGAWLALLVSRHGDVQLACRPLAGAGERPADDARTVATPSLASLALPALEALHPRPAAPALGDGAVDAVLAAQRAQVAAWCELAIADGWDTGRLAFPGAGELPFADEIDALVDGRTLGRAAARVARARERLAALPPLDGHSGGATPLGQLAVEFDLSDAARRILLVVAAPALWGEFARLYAVVANDKGRALVDEYLVTQVLGREVDARTVARELDPRGPLVAGGLVQVGGGTRPFAELRADPIVLRRLRGDRFDAPEPSDVVTLRAPDRPLAALAIARAPVEEIVRAMATRRPAPLRLVVKGHAGVGRRSLLAALAAHARRPLGVLDVSRLGVAVPSLPSLLATELRRTVLRGWLPCLTGLEALPAEPTLLASLRAVLREHGGPLVVRAGEDTPLPLDPGHVDVTLPLGDATARAAVWRDALARRGLSTAPAEALAGTYRVGPGIVEAVVAHVDGLDDGDLARALRRALQQHRDERIGAIATRVKQLPTWDDVVLPPEIKDSVREFIGRIRHRQLVYERWGFQRVTSTAKGLTALFMGGPGTGKTLVAGLIARELGFDLYRVDLSRMVSKWIGETEKSLGALFDAAEDGQVVLVFDEADSLFAKRTEVKSSTDRYANLEVNYLLQRLDSFEGIAILTTNLSTSIDAAFRRRLSIRLSFPFPDEEMREELWRVHLPPELPVEGALDLVELARRFQLSGGYIRNAALRAAFLAASEGSALTQQHLERAVALEYRETGKIVEDGVLE